MQKPECIMYGTMLCVVASGDWRNQSPPFLCIFDFFDILVLLLMNAESFACKSWVFFHLLTDPRVMVGILLHCGVKTEESAVMYCHTVSKLKRNDEI